MTDSGFRLKEGTWQDMLQQCTDYIVVLEKQRRILADALVVAFPDDKLPRPPGYVMALAHEIVLEEVQEVDVPMTEAMKCIKGRMTVGHGETAAYCATHQCMFADREGTGDLCRVAKLEAKCAEYDRCLQGVNSVAGKAKADVEELSKRLKALAEVVVKDYPEKKLPRPPGHVMAYAKEALRDPGWLYVDPKFWDAPHST